MPDEYEVKIGKKSEAVSMARRGRKMSMWLAITTQFNTYADDCKPRYFNLYSPPPA